MSNFKFTPLQKMWIKQLKKHPERQTDGFLGEGTPRNYKACCLGEGLLCIYRMKKKKLPFINGVLFDLSTNFEQQNKSANLEFSYKKLGLQNSNGILKNTFECEKNGRKKEFASLTEMNDGGFTWAEIAKYIEKNPENIFTISK